MSALSAQECSRLYDVLVLALISLAEQGQRPNVKEIAAEIRRQGLLRLPKKGAALAPWLRLIEELLTALGDSYVRPVGWQMVATPPKALEGITITGEREWSAIIGEAYITNSLDAKIRATARKLAEATLRWKHGTLLMDGRMVPTTSVIPSAFAREGWQLGFQAELYHLVKEEVGPLIEATDEWEDRLAHVSWLAGHLVELLLTHYIPQSGDQSERSYTTPVSAVDFEGLLNLYRLAIRLALGQKPKVLFQVGYGGSSQNGDPLAETNLRVLSYALPPIQLLESLHQSGPLDNEQLEAFQIRFFVAHQSAHFVNQMKMDELWATATARFAFIKAFLEWRNTLSPVLRKLDWDFERPWFNSQEALAAVRKLGQKVLDGADRVSVAELVLWLLERAASHVQDANGARTLISDLKTRAAQYMAVHPLLFLDLYGPLTSTFSRYGDEKPADFIVSFGGIPETKFLLGRHYLTTHANDRGLVTEAPRGIMLFVNIGRQPPVYYPDPLGDLTVRDVVNQAMRRLGPCAKNDLLYLEADLHTHQRDWEHDFVRWVQNWVRSLPQDPTPGNLLAHQVAMAASLGSVSAQRCLDVISTLEAKQVIVEKLFAVLDRAHRELMGFPLEPAN